MRNKKKKMNEREEEERKRVWERRGREGRTRDAEKQSERERESGDGSTVIRVTNFPLTPFASLCSTVWTRLIINTHIRFWKTRLGVSGWETFFFFFKSSTRRIFALFLAVSKLLSKTSFSMFSPSGFFFFSMIEMIPCFSRNGGFWFCTSLELDV